MRRMADIIVHETLTRAIMKDEPKMISKEEIELINLGRTHTKRLKRDLNEVYICLMLYKKKTKISTEAIIVSYGKMSVSLYIPLF